MSATAPPRVITVVSAVILAAGLAACSGGSTTAAGRTTGASSSSTTSAATSSPSAGGSAGPTATTPPSTKGGTGGSDADGGARPVPTATTPVAEQNLAQSRKLPNPKRTAVLTGIRAVGHQGYDRVVFAFDGPIGGYSVRYVDPLTLDPTDVVVPHAGSAALRVSMVSATRDASNSAADGETPRTYTGPAGLKPNLVSVKEIVPAGDFEATLTYGIGVDGTKPFSVLLLSDPTRLVVDVAH